MSSQSRARRAGAFVRSVLPAEPAHWLILVGSTLLFISGHLWWWVGSTPSSARNSLLGIYEFLVIPTFVLSGATGYYLCFVRRKTSGHYPFLLVLLPAAGGLAALAAIGYSWFTGLEGPVSVVAEATDKEYFLHSDILRKFGMDFGLGYWLAASGLVLSFAFFALLRLGRTTLPVRLPTSAVLKVSENTDVEEREHRRTMIFVWAMISLVPLASLLANLSMRVALVTPSAHFLRLHPDYLPWISRVAFSLCIFLLICVAMRTRVRQTLREAFRLPPATYLVTAILIPATLAAIWPLCLFMFDRIHWAAFAFGMSAAPRLTTYFGFPIWTELWA